MYLDEAKVRFEQLNILSTGELLPCTEQEVRLLEQNLGFSLPKAYGEFLLWMGHGAGEFLRGSDCFYQHLPHLRSAATELLQENSFPEPLPNDSFVFFMHQGYQFNFLNLSEGENPPVYFYGEWKDLSSFERIYPSYSEFLLREIEDHAKLISASTKRGHLAKL